MVCASPTASPGRGSAQAFDQAKQPRERLDPLTRLAPRRQRASALSASVLSKTTSSLGEHPLAPGQSHQPREDVALADTPLAGAEGLHPCNLGARAGVREEVCSWR